MTKFNVNLDPAISRAAWLEAQRLHRRCAQHGISLSLTYGLGAAVMIAVNKQWVKMPFSDVTIAEVHHWIKARDNRPNAARADIRRQIAAQMDGRSQPLQHRRAGA